MEYKLLKKEEDNIYFYVARDFSDIDIENFRRVFEIRNEDRILRIGDSWRRLIDRCNGEKKSLSNFLVIINESGKVEKVQRF
jgi:hypothetical protein